MSAAGLLLKKKAFARGVLACLEKSAVSPSQFMSICTSSERIPARFRMTTTEAADFLTSLERAGVALQVTADQIHLRPVEVVDAVHLRAGIPQLSRSTPRLAASRRELGAVAQAGLTQNEERLSQVVAKQKRFWAFTAALSSTQMTALAYLQFQVFGWDVMEPATYFITTTTALVAYVYFLYFRREHSYQSVDEHLVPGLLSRDIRVAKGKVAEWVRASEMATELERVSASVEDEAADLLALAKEMPASPQQL